MGCRPFGNGGVRNPWRGAGLFSPRRPDAFTSFCTMTFCDLLARPRQSNWCGTRDELPFELPLSWDNNVAGKWGTGFQSLVFSSLDDVAQGWESFRKNPDSWRGPRAWLTFSRAFLMQEKPLPDFAFPCYTSTNLLPGRWIYEAARPWRNINVDGSISGNYAGSLTLKAAEFFSFWDEFCQTAGTVSLPQQNGLDGISSSGFFAWLSWLKHPGACQTVSWILSDSF